MDESLKNQTAIGVVWSAVQRFGSLAISFISSIILARLLTPEDYGVIGVLSIFIALSLSFIDGGFGSALIQKKNPTQTDYSTIFYWNILLSIFLYVILYVAAPLIAVFYNMSILTRVLRVEGLILLINAFQIIPNNQLRKQLKFKPLSIIFMLSAFMSVCIGIVLAFYGFGVWSLVAQQLANGLFTTLLLWKYNKWVPILVFDKKSFTELFSFGGFLLISNLINTFCNNIQGLIIGRLFSVRDMGFYSKAHSLEEIPSKGISDVIMQVTYPVFSKIQDDKERLKNALRTIVSATAFITIPIMILLIVIAKPLIILLFSDRWIESIPYFQILCLAGIAMSIQGINYNVVAAVGHSKTIFKWVIIKRAIGLCFLGLGLIWGIKGLLWGMVAGSFTIYFINAIIASNVVNYRLLSQLKDLTSIATISLISFGSTYFIPQMLPWNIYLIGLIQMVVFVGGYLLISYLVKSSALYFGIDIIKQLIHQRK